MANVDVDPFGDHDKPDNHPDEPMGELLPSHPRRRIYLGTKTRTRNVVWWGKPGNNTHEIIC